MNTLVATSNFSFDFLKTCKEKGWIDRLKISWFKFTTRSLTLRNLQWIILSGENCVYRLQSLRPDSNLYCSWNITNHASETHNINLRPTTSNPAIQYQRVRVMGSWRPHIKQRFWSRSKRFSPRTASKIHEHFSQQNESELFATQTCFIPFLICRVLVRQLGWHTLQMRLYNVLWWIPVKPNGP